MIDANNHLLALPEELQERIWRNVYVNVVEQFKDIIEKHCYDEYWPEICIPRYLPSRGPLVHHKYFNPITGELVDNKVSFGRGLISSFLRKSDLYDCTFSDPFDNVYFEDLQRFYDRECFAYDDWEFRTDDQYFRRVADDFDPDPDKYDHDDFEDVYEDYENYNEGDSFDRDRDLPFIPY